MLLESNTIQEFLTRELDRRVRVNPRYSQRGFARALGLSPGELSEVLRAKRKLGLKAALKISRAMGLNPAETKHLLHLAQLEKSKDWNIETRLTAEPVPMQASEMETDVVHLLSEWHHFALLTLLDTSDFRWNSIWIAKRLGLTRTQAKAAMDRLLRLGLIRKNQAGRFVGTNEMLFSTAGVPSESIRSYHKQLLTKAIDALEFQPVQERDISGISFACDPNDLESIRREISEFQDKLIARYRKGKLTEVYHLETALFRLTEGASRES